MIFLSILDGPQTGNHIEITQDATLNMASSLGSDIYLILPSWSDFECSFSVHNGMLTFNQTSHEFTVNNLAVEIGYAYETPALCTIDNTNIAFSNDPYIQLENFTLKDTASTKFTELEPDSDELAALGVTPFEAKEQSNKVEKLLTGIVRRYSNSKFGRTIKKFTHKVRQSNFFVQLTNLVDIGKKQFQTYYQIIYKKLGYWLYLCLGFILLSIAILFIVIYQLRQEEHKESLLHNHQIIKSLLDQKLLKLPNRYSNLRLTDKNNGYQISGIVDNINDINYVKHIFAPINPDIKFDLILFSKIKPSLLQILLQHKILQPKVSFESDSGVLAIGGITNSMEIIDDAEIAIANKYPSLGHLDTSKMFISSDIDSNFDSIFNTDKFKQHLSISKDYAQGSILVEGYLASNDIAELEKKVEQFNQKYSPQVTITLKLQDLIKALPFGITEVYTGSPSWIITDDGQRIYQGGSYKGVTLSQIDNEKIVLVGKFVLALPLNQLLPAQMSNGTRRVVATYQDSRKEIIENEKNTESDLINKEKSQLESLKLIFSKTAESQLKSSLKETIDNLEEDLVYRQTEYEYYFKESKK